MPALSRMQQLTVVEILDRAVRLYRMNLRVGVLLPGSLVLTIALVRYMFQSGSGAADWDAFVQLRADGLATLLSGLTGSTGASALQAISWASLIGYPLQQMFIVGVIVPYSAQRYLQQFTDLIPARHGWAARIFALFLPVLVLLPIDVLIACLARFFEFLPFALRIGQLGAALAPLMVWLNETLVAPIAISLVAALAVARLWCAPQAIVLEGSGVPAGFRRSWRLTRRHFGRVAALVVSVSVIVALIGALPASVAVFIGGLTSAALPSKALLSAGLLIAKITQLLVLPVPPIVATLLYYDLRVRAEGYDLEVTSNQTLYESADVKRQQGDLQGALADLERLCRLVPSDIYLLGALVELKTQLGDLDGALAGAERAIALFPNQWHSWNLRGYVRMLRDDFDGALADFDHALRRAAHNPVLLINRADVLHRRGDYEGARTVLFHALNAAPEDARAMYNMACGYALQGQHESAIEWLDRAAAIEAQVRADAIADADFDSLRAHPRFVALVTGEAQERRPGSV